MTLATTSELARQMAELAMLKPAHTVFVPGGDLVADGHLVMACQNAAGKPGKPGSGSLVHCAARDAGYDRIVINPLDVPFYRPDSGREADVNHVAETLKLLKPGGILVALMLDNFSGEKFKALTGRFDTEGVKYVFAKPLTPFKHVHTIILKVTMPKGKKESVPQLTVAVEPGRADLPVRHLPPLPAVTCEGVIGSFASEPVHDQSTLDRYIRVYPQFESNLRELHASLPQLAESKVGQSTNPPIQPSTNPVPVPSTTTPKHDTITIVENPKSKIQNMKLTIPQPALVAALAAVKSAAPPKTEIPILANVLLQAEQPATVTFTCCAADFSLCHQADATVETPGATTVRASLFFEIAKRLSKSGAEDATVILELVGDVLHVQCGEIKFHLATMAAAEFPPVPEVEDAIEFTLEESALHRRLASTQFATSTNEGRFLLNGTFIEINGKLTFAACDGRLLAMVSSEAPEVAAPAGMANGTRTEMIVPARTVAELLRLLNPHDESSEVQVTVNKNLVTFAFGASLLTSKLIEGKYVEFRKIIPKDSEPVATIYREELLNAVNRVGLVADFVRLDFKPKSLTVQSTRLTGDKKEPIGEVADRLFCSITRELTLVLGVRALREALEATSADQLQVFADSHIAMLKSPEDHWLAVIAGAPPKKA